MRLDGPVLVIGAGIGGLTLASALARRGMACRLFERARALVPIGAGILVQAGALLALRALELDEAVVAGGQPVELGLLRTDVGETLQRTSMGFLKDELGALTVAIHRGRLQEVLLAGCEGTPVELGAELASYEVDAGGVTAIFADGRRERGALLVGADGLHSAVRRALLGDSPLRYAGYTSWRGVAAVSDATTAHEVVEMWGRGARFGFAAVGQGRTYWFAVLNAPAGERDADSLALVTRHFAGWAEPVPRLLAHTRGEHVFRTDIHDRPPVASWSRGRVTLLGDAAHPTTPNLGQGGSMAIEDAVVLAHALERAPNLADALADYEARRVARTGRIVDASFRFGKLAQTENRLVIWLRNALMRWTPERIVQKELRRAADFKLEGEIVRA